MPTIATSTRFRCSRSSFFVFSPDTNRDRRKTSIHIESFLFSFVWFALFNVVLYQLQLEKLQNARFSMRNHDPVRLDGRRNVRIEWSAMHFKTSTGPGRQCAGRERMRCILTSVLHKYRRHGQDPSCHAVHQIGDVPRFWSLMQQSNTQLRGREGNLCVCVWDHFSEN